MTEQGGIASEILATLSRWAPWIWSGSSVLGLAVCARLWHSVRGVRRASAWRGLDENDDLLVTLLYFERLALTAAAVLLAMVGIGLSSVLLEHNVWVSIATLGVLLMLPTFLTWVVYRALRLRLR